jgi:hypothetical protein
VLQGGGYRSNAPRGSIASRTPATLWLPRLSATTVSPGRSAGARFRQRSRQTLQRELLDTFSLRGLEDSERSSGTGFCSLMAGSGSSPLLSFAAANGDPGRIMVLSAVGVSRRMMVSEALAS